MEEFHNILRSSLLVAQFLAALVGTFYFFRLKNSYWKWFAIYLVFIFIQEFFWRNRSSFFGVPMKGYYIYFGTVLEWIFFYWLYALKSLKKKRLFLVCSLIYLITIGIAILSSKDINQVSGLSLNVGTIILTLLVVLEFIKQIKNDDILRFRENKMFYINIAMVLFYLGSYPFHVYAKELYNEHKTIYDVYFTYFLISNCIMYLLFTASFIWGKMES